LASRLGRENDAVAALENAAHLEPKSPDSFFELGKLYESAQNWPQARLAFEHVIELNPSFAAAHFQLSRVYARLGLRAESEKEALRTHLLVDQQREDALLRQRQRAGSFQNQTTTIDTKGRCDYCRRLSYLIGLNASSGLQECVRATLPLLERKAPNRATTNYPSQKPEPNGSEFRSFLGACNFERRFGIIEEN